MLWIISLITFFLSPVLDNLTTAIVMVLLLHKIVSDPKDRLYFVGMIVIASNAGGTWSPIGDVTTTMLWMGGQITAGNIIKELFLPGIVSLIVPLLLVSARLKGNINKIKDISSNSAPFLSHSFYDQLKNAHVEDAININLPGVSAGTLPEMHLQK